MWQRGPDGEILRVSPPPDSPEPGEEGSPEAGEPRAGKARLGLALKLGLRDTYDYLGAVVAGSFLWFVVAGFAVMGGFSLAQSAARNLPGLLPPLISVLCALLAFVLAGGPLAGGIFRYARQGAMREEPELFDLAWGFRTAPRRCIALGGIQVSAFFVLIGNCVFYLSHTKPVFVVLGATVGYLTCFWLLMCLYQWPLLVELDQPPLTVIKKSGLLVLDNLPYSFAVGFLLFAISLVLWLTVIGGALLWAGAVSMIATQATRELLRKYGVLGPDPTLDPISREVGE
jgi:uncharacterized membrane protein YesL